MLKKCHHTGKKGKGEEIGERKEREEIGEGSGTIEV